MRESRRDKHPAVAAITAVLCVAFAPASQASFREYDSSADTIQSSIYKRFRFPALTPTVAVHDLDFGSFFLDDEGLGHVTANELSFGFDHATTTNLTSAPGSYHYLRLKATYDYPGGAVGTGITVPGGHVDWGVLSGWTQTGDMFCRSTPPSSCGIGGAGEDASTPVATLTTHTYDIGTWSFDAEGDFEATPYIANATFCTICLGGGGGVLDELIQLRGRLVAAGPSVPALPIAGLALLAAGLAVSVGRRRRR